MPHLLVRKGSSRGQCFPINRPRTVIGREKDCDVILTTPESAKARQKGTVSRKHAIITRDHGKYYIEDGNGDGRKSHNGTVVNDKPVPFPGRVQLKVDDIIRICDTQLVFCADADDPPSGSSIEASISPDSSLFLTQPAEKLKVLLEITNRLSNTLELETLLPQVVEALLQIFKQANRGFLILVDEASGELVRRSFKARKQEDEAHTGFSASIVRECVETMQGLLSNNVAGDYPGSESVAGLSLRSVMCVPLWNAEGKAFGVLQLDSHDLRRKFTEEDLNLLMAVASQASIALSNARFHRDALARERHRQDLITASQVVKSFLPERVPEIPGYGFYACYESALEVGGDYYDFLPLSGNRLGILVGDVAGKGVPAALVMARFSAEAKSYLRNDAELDQAVAQLNSMMQPLSFTSRFMTLVGLVLDPATHTVTLVNAGHPAPLVHRRAGGAIEEAIPRASSGLMLGVLDGERYQTHQIVLEPGDCMILFTDGVTDAMNVEGRQLDLDGLRAVLAQGCVPPRELGERILKAVKTHSLGCTQHDDITLVCLGRMA